MATDTNRRQFKRLPLSEDAIAIDRGGRELGKVSDTGGGGMMIQTASEKIADSLSVGQRLQVTVHEPKTKTSHTIDITVRYKDGRQVGVEFVTGKQNP